MSMQRSMKKLFGNKTVTSTATVVRRISATELEVVGLTGLIKMVSVERGAFYPIGAGVRIESGVVIGNSGILGDVQTVRV